MTTKLMDILHGFSSSVTLMPGLSEEELKSFEARRPGPLPPAIKDLLAYTAGFEMESVQLAKQKRTQLSDTVSVLFKGSGTFGFDVLPNAIDVLGDGCGNFWLVDVTSCGDWGTIMYVCHDPPVIAVQAASLVDFLLQLLQPGRGEPPNALRFVRDQAVAHIWKRDPWLMSAHNAKLSADAVIRGFADQLSDEFCVADLRPREVGSGFSWGKAGANTQLKRAGSDLIFGIERKLTD